MNDLIRQISDSIAKSEPSKETFWVWVGATVVMAGLSYYMDNTGTFTIPALVGSMVLAGLNYITSKSRYEDAKQVKAQAEKDVKAVTEPGPGNTNF